MADPTFTSDDWQQAAGRCETLYDQMRGMEISVDSMLRDIPPGLDDFDHNVMLERKANGLAEVRNALPDLQNHLKVVTDAINRLAEEVDDA